MKHFFHAPHALLTFLLVCVGLALACAVESDNAEPLDSDALLEADEAGDAQDIISPLSGLAGDTQDDGMAAIPSGPAGDAEEDGMAAIPSGPAGDAGEDGMAAIPSGPAGDTQEASIGSAMPLQASLDTAPGDNE